ncbi:hypothetical protein GOBAR_AA00353 [Gossypium barbadense]|uniref:Uncharacterized protein n=1 Tax=Gossypium barbadense TaxID=3634 RepID=A0A2P5YXB3_GOSBA|nr:hypothetical protein GOBAR_AA00353 [Gossypium barbadense]
MSMLSFRPRPLDIYKKLPVVKSVKDFEDDDTPTSATRNSQMLRLAAVKVETEFFKNYWGREQARCQSDVSSALNKPQ